MYRNTKSEGSPEIATPRRIDVHTHYMAQALVSALEARSDAPRIFRQNGGRAIEYGANNGHDLLPTMVDLDAQLRDMDAAGIDFAILSVQVPGVDWFPAADGVAVARDVNDELADITRRHPDRLAALALLPGQAPDEAAAELERAVAAGLRGGVVFSNVAGRDLDAAGIGPLVDAAAALDVPLMIHPTYPLSAAATDAYALIPAVGFLVDTTMAALRLIIGGLYERHPDFKLYLCHAASLLPQLAGRIDYECSRFPGGTGKLDALPSERFAQLYTDTVCVWPSALHSTLALVGDQRVMFGSDYPFWEASATIDAVARAELAPATRDAVEAGNAARLFDIAGAAPA
ncbi:MAG TPA: amidohydrolase family protein [Solirubrobacteraceae bacterium]|nr:amidohydrolase family protein [Solirubrobacteraceae bacterium]